MTVDLGQAKMPREFLGRKLRSLKEGESAWTVPWAVEVNAKRECFLNVALGCSAKPAGDTSTLKVTRLEGGWRAVQYQDLDKPLYTWEAEHVEADGQHIVPLNYFSVEMQAGDARQ